MEDLARDAAALFRHLRNLGVESDAQTRWCFMFQADEIEPLDQLGGFLDGRLREYFHVLLQETSDVLEDENTSEGPPLLRLEFVGVLDEPTLAGMHKRLEELAAEYGVNYQGCSSQREFPFDLDMFEAALGDEPQGDFMPEDEQD
jgi:hypothetical protein